VRTASAAAARIPGLDEARIARLREDLAALAGEGEAT
jgi:membrane protein YdbS with pleckstrin-like domain